MFFQNTRRLATFLSIGFVTSWIVGAEPLWASSPAVLLSDDVLQADGDSFVVKRRAFVNSGSPYEVSVRSDLVRFSVWDGHEMARCGLGVETHRDAKKNGNWGVEKTDADKGCATPKAALKGLKLDKVVYQGGAIYVNGRKIVTAEFVQQRLDQMLKSEVSSCKADGGKQGGCDLARLDAGQAGLGELGKTSDTHVFIPLRTNAGKSSERDFAKVWIAFGRKYWDAAMKKAGSELPPEEADKAEDVKEADGSDMAKKADENAKVSALQVPPARASVQAKSEAQSQKEEAPKEQKTAGEVINVPPARRN